MTYNWFKCQYTAAELNNKSVNFRVPLEQGGILEGEGRLKAVQNPQGLIRVAIDYVHIDKDVATGTRVFIPQEAYSKIMRNPPASKCEFSVIVC